MLLHYKLNCEMQFNGNVSRQVQVVWHLQNTFIISNNRLEFPNLKKHCSVAFSRHFYSNSIIVVCNVCRNLSTNLISCLMR